MTLKVNKKEIKLGEDMRVKKSSLVRSHKIRMSERNSSRTEFHNPNIDTDGSTTISKIANIRPTIKAGSHEKDDYLCFTECIRLYLFVFETENPTLTFANRLK